MITETGEFFWSILTFLIRFLFIFYKIVFIKTRYFSLTDVGSDFAVGLQFLGIGITWYDVWGDDWMSHLLHNIGMHKCEYIVYNLESENYVNSSCSKEDQYLGIVTLTIIYLPSVKIVSALYGPSKGGFIVSVLGAISFIIFLSMFIYSSITGISILDFFDTNYVVNHVE